MPSDYSIHVLEYGQTVDQPVGIALYGAYNAGTKPMPYGFVALESAEHLVLVDVGFEATGSGEEFRQKFHVDPYILPAEALRSIGRSPADVTHVIVTHAHYDHMGALGLFPNAHYFLQREELAKWRWALGKGPRYTRLTAACNPDDIAAAEALIEVGRMTLLDGPQREILPGISVEVAPNSHSYMQQFAVIETASAGRFIAAGDGAFSRTNFTGIDHDGAFVPLGFGVGSQTDMVVALDQILSIAGGDVERILIVHEPDTYTGATAWVSSTGMRVAEIAVRSGDGRRPAAQQEQITRVQASSSTHATDL